MHLGLFIFSVTENYFPGEDLHKKEIIFYMLYIDRKTEHSAVHCLPV